MIEQRFSELCIIADSRERDAKRISAVKEYVEKLGGVFEVSGLPNNGGGDYHIQGYYKESEIDLCIEYKTLVDFSSSYQQLPERFRNAYTMYNEVALVLEIPKYSFSIEADGFHGTIQNKAVRDGSADVLKYFTFQGMLQSIVYSYWRLIVCS